MRSKTAKNIDEYIAEFPSLQRELLTKLRIAIGKAAPKAEEKISYGMACFALNGNLVYFAGYNGHIGFYPGPRSIQFFKKDLAAYDLSKGTVRLPLDKPLPIRIITSIVKFRVEENKIKATLKKKKK